MPLLAAPSGGFAPPFEQGFPASLSAAVGIRLDSFRDAHIRECVRRAIARERVADVHSLVQRLRSDDEARSRFRRTVAVSVTDMFRDPGQFEVVDGILARIARSSPQRRVRVWSAGCANGAEVHTLAILLERHGLLDGALLTGSDLLEENIEVARSGALRTPDVPAAAAALTRFEVRDLVHDEPPAGGFSLVLCRNVAIYLGAEGRAALHGRLAGSLAPGGVLVVGRTERIADPAGIGLDELEPHVYGRSACATS